MEMLSAEQARNYMVLPATKQPPNEFDKCMKAIHLALYRTNGRAKSATVNFIIADETHTHLLNLGYEIAKGVWQEDQSPFTIIRWLK